MSKCIFFYICLLCLGYYSVESSFATFLHPYLFLDVIVIIITVQRRTNSDIVVLNPGNVNKNSPLKVCQESFTYASSLLFGWHSCKKRAKKGWKIVNHGTTQNEWNDSEICNVNTCSSKECVATSAYDPNEKCRELERRICNFVTSCFTLNDHTTLISSTSTQLKL